jgi:hypothetical protein
MKQGEVGTTLATQLRRPTLTLDANCPGTHYAPAQQTLGILGRRSVSALTLWGSNDLPIV